MFLNAILKTRSRSSSTQGKLHYMLRIHSPYSQSPALLRFTIIACVTHCANVSLYMIDDNIPQVKVKKILLLWGKVYSSKLRWYAEIAKYINK